jgi:hypothetical protein
MIVGQFTLATLGGVLFGIIMSKLSDLPYVWDYRDGSTVGLDCFQRQGQKLPQVHHWWNNLWIVQPFSRSYVFII